MTEQRKLLFLKLTTARKGKQKERSRLRRSNREDGRLIVHHHLTYASFLLRSHIAIGYNVSIKSGILLEIVLFFTRGKRFGRRVFLIYNCFTDRKWNPVKRTWCLVWVTTQHNDPLTAHQCATKHWLRNHCYRHWFYLYILWRQVGRNIGCLP